MASIDSITGSANNETLATLALRLAQGQLGQSEKPIGSNSGPMVDQYLRSVGLNPGYAWCQAFVFWCYEEAAKKLSLPNPVVKTAGVHDCWNRSSPSGTAKTNGNTADRKQIQKTDALHNPELLKPGCQFVLLFGGTAGHTGIVEKVEGTVLHTIEGNSNNSGSREGYEVVRHQRNITDKALEGFIVYAS